MGTAHDNPVQGAAPPARRRWPEALALFLLFFSLYALLGRGIFFSSDEGGGYNTALALIHSGSLAIWPGENVHVGRDGRHYSCREILPTLCCVPTCVVGGLAERLANPRDPPLAKAFWLPHRSNWPAFVSVTLLGPLAAAGTLLLMRSFVLLEGGTPADALWLTLTAGLATPLAVYAKTIFPQVFEAFLLMAAFLAAARWRRRPSPGAAFALGVACGLGLMNRVTFVPVSGFFLLFLLTAGNAGRRKRVRDIAAAVLPMLVGAAVTGWVNWLRWGSPFDTGRHRPDETFSTPLWLGLYGLLVSPGK